tara:strand:+ start:335 stop:2512 length:2178 start_codon:yes stop_codon:yes gene_type:complete
MFNSSNKPTVVFSPVQAGSGSSALLERMVDSQFKPPGRSTIGTEIRWLTKFHSHSISQQTDKAMIRCFDTPGNERFFAMTRVICKDADILVCVLDGSRLCAQKNSFGWWLHSQQEACRQGIPIVVVVTKSDLIKLVDESAIEATLDGWREQGDFTGVFLVSAKTGENIDVLKSFLWHLVDPVVPEPKKATPKEMASQHLAAIIPINIADSQNSVVISRERRSDKECIVKSYDNTQYPELLASIEVLVSVLFGLIAPELVAEVKLSDRSKQVTLISLLPNYKSCADFQKDSHLTVALELLKKVKPRLVILWLVMTYVLENEDLHLGNWGFSGGNLVTIDFDNAMVSISSALRNAAIIGQQGTPGYSAFDVDVEDVKHFPCLTTAKPNAWPIDLSSPDGGVKDISQFIIDVFSANKAIMCESFFQAYGLFNTTLVSELFNTLIPSQYSKLSGLLLWHFRRRLRAIITILLRENILTEAVSRRFQFSHYQRDSMRTAVEQVVNAYKQGPPDQTQRSSKFWQEILGNYASGKFIKLQREMTDFSPPADYQEDYFRNYVYGLDLLLQQKAQVVKLASIFEKEFWKQFYKNYREYFGDNVGLLNFVAFIYKIIIWADDSHVTRRQNDFITDSFQTYSEALRCYRELSGNINENYRSSKWNRLTYLNFKQDIKVIFSGATFVTLYPQSSIWADHLLSYQQAVPAFFKKHIEGKAIRSKAYVQQVLDIWFSEK